MKIAMLKVNYYFKLTEESKKFLSRLEEIKRSLHTDISSFELNYIQKYDMPEIASNLEKIQKIVTGMEQYINETGIKDEKRAIEILTDSINTREHCAEELKSVFESIVKIKNSTLKEELNNFSLSIEEIYTSIKKTPCINPSYQISKLESALEKIQKMATEINMLSENAGISGIKDEDINLKDYEKILNFVVIDIKNAKLTYLLDKFPPVIDRMDKMIKSIIEASNISLGDMVKNQLDNSLNNMVNQIPELELILGKTGKIITKIENYAKESGISNDERTITILTNGLNKQKNNEKALKSKEEEIQLIKAEIQKKYDEIQKKEKEKEETIYKPVFDLIRNFDSKFKDSSILMKHLSDKRFYKVVKANIKEMKKIMDELQNKYPNIIKDEKILEMNYNLEQSKKNFKKFKQSVGCMKKLYFKL